MHCQPVIVPYNVERPGIKEIWPTDRPTDLEDFYILFTAVRAALLSFQNENGWCTVIDFYSVHMSTACDATWWMLWCVKVIPSTQVIVGWTIDGEETVLCLCSLAACNMQRVYCFADRASERATARDGRLRWALRWSFQIELDTSVYCCRDRSLSIEHPSLAMAFFSCCMSRIEEEEDDWQREEVTAQVWATSSRSHQVESKPYASCCRVVRVVV